MTNATKGKIIKYVAIALDVIAPLIATITQFPVWVEESSEATVSGLFLLLAFLCILPFYKHVLKYLKSPSITVVWAVIYILMVAMQDIIDQMVVVCFVGLIANALGEVLFKLGSWIEKKDKDKKEA